jgi:hypothetical protein
VFQFNRIVGRAEEQGSAGVPCLGRALQHQPCSQRRPTSSPIPRHASRATSSRSSWRIGEEEAAAWSTAAGMGAGDATGVAAESEGDLHDLQGKSRTPF